MIGLRMELGLVHVYLGIRSEVVFFCGGYSSLWILLFSTCVSVDSKLRLYAIENRWYFEGSLKLVLRTNFLRGKFGREEFDWFELKDPRVPSRWGGLMPGLSLGLDFAFRVCLGDEAQCECESVIE